MDKKIKIILGIVIGFIAINILCVGFIVVWTGGLLKSTSDMFTIQQTPVNFIESLESEDYQSAKNYLSEELKSNIGEAKEIQKYLNIESNITSYKMEWMDIKSKLKAIAKFTIYYENGSISVMMFTLEYKNKRWEITMVTNNFTKSAQPAGEAELAFGFVFSSECSSAIGCILRFGPALPANRLSARRWAATFN